MPGAHRIHRQVIEVTVPSAESAQIVSDRVSVIQTQIFDCIARALDRIEHDFGPIRLDRLDFDVGTLRADQIEADLDLVLPGILDSAISAANPTDAVGADVATDQNDLALIDMTLGQGRLPWWSDATDRSLLPDALIRMAASDPERLRLLLQRLLERGFVCGRLSRLPWSLLARLMDLLHPGSGSEVAGMARWWTRSARRPKRDVQVIWASAFKAVAKGRGGSELWPAMVRDLTETRPDMIGQLVHAVATPLDGHPAPGMSGLDQAQPAIAASVVQDLMRLAVLAPALAPLWERIANAARSRPATAGALAGTLTAVLRPNMQPIDGAELAEAIKGLGASPDQADAMSRAVKDAWPDGSQTNPRALIAVLRQAMRQKLLAPEDVVELLGQTSPSDPTIAVLQATDWSDDNPNPARDDPEIARDGLPVIDAGLVLLWPFLKTFFDRAELLDEGAFKNADARDHAVSLLHLAVTGQTNPPEFQVTLPKLLVGMDPAQPWAPSQTIKPQDQALVEDLLTGVIAQIPDLGLTSIDGLRGSFLLRGGVLTADPAGWLLRVEPQSYDMLLERLPWSYVWVKLPWMQTVLQVDW